MGFDRRGESAHSIFLKTTAGDSFIRFVGKSPFDHTGKTAKK
jgi:hypothetical protein